MLMGLSAFPDVYGHLDFPIHEVPVQVLFLFFFFFFLHMFSVVSQRFSIAQFAASCFATVDQNRSVSMS